VREGQEEHGETNRRDTQGHLSTMFHATLAPIRVPTRARRLVALLALLVPLALLSTGRESQAHGKDLSTSPADGASVDRFPESIEIVFNEKVTLLEYSTILLDSQGTSVVLAARTEDYKNGSKVILDPPKPLPPEGWYAVNWRAVSADSHPIAGTFTFFYGDPSLSATSTKVKTVSNPAQPYINIATVLRILSYLAILMTIGANVFLWIVGGKNAEVYTRAGKHAWRISVTTAVTGFVTTLLLLVNTAIILNGGSFTSLGLIVQIVAAGPVGSALLIRVSALFGVCTGLLLLSEKSLRKLGAAVFVLSSVVYVYSYAMSSHVYVVPLKWVAVFGFVLHMVGSSIWLGAIPSLALALRSTGRNKEGHPLESVNAAKLSIVDRFSKVATLAVAFVGVGGLLASFTMFNNVTEYYSTNYGRFLLLKVLLVLCAGLIGAYNHFVLVPSLRKEPNDAKTHETLRRSVIKELALFFLIVLATGALTYNSAPKAGGNHFSGHSGGGHMGGVDGSQLASRLDPVIVRVPVAAGEIQVEYYPGERSVENAFKVILTGGDGLNIPISKASIRFARPDLQIAGFEREMTISGGAIPTLLTRDLGVAGTWKAEITLTAANGDLIQAPFDVEVTDTLRAGGE